MSSSVDSQRLASESRWQPTWLRIRDQRTVGVLVLGYLTLLAGPLLVRAAAGRIHRVDQPQAPPRLIVDVNHAPLEELSLLPGIGPSLASRMIAHRELTPFVYVEQLRAVRGIGPKTLDRLRGLVICVCPEGTHADADVTAKDEP